MGKDANNMSQKNRFMWKNMKAMGGVGPWVSVVGLGVSVSLLIIIIICYSVLPFLF